MEYSSQDILSPIKGKIEAKPHLQMLFTISKYSQTQRMRLRIVFSFRRISPSSLWEKISENFSTMTVSSSAYLSVKCA